MSLKKTSGAILAVFGVLIFVFGCWQYNQACAPNQCVVSFAKSLGGKSSLEYEDSLRRKKLLGSFGMSLGTILFFSGGVVFFKSQKKPC